MRQSADRETAVRYRRPRPRIRSTSSTHCARQSSLPRRPHRKRVYLEKVYQHRPSPGHHCYYHILNLLYSISIITGRHPPPPPYHGVHVVLFWDVVPRFQRWKSSDASPCICERYQSRNSCRLVSHVYQPTAANCTVVT